MWVIDLGVDDWSLLMRTEDIESSGEECDAAR